MMRFLFFATLAVWCAAALMPERIKIWQTKNLTYDVVATDELLSAQRAYDKLSQLSDSDDGKARAALCLAKAFWIQRKYNEAYGRFLKIAQAREPLNLEYDKLLIEARLGAAGVLRDCATYHGALKMYEEVLAYDRRRLATDAPGIARDLNNIAFVHYLASMYGEDVSAKREGLKSAEKMFLDALKIERARASSTAAEARTLQMLSYVYKQQGRREEADMMLNQAREIEARLQRPCREP
ncbi:MAG TPA: hypothetical protein V6D17_08970 [Candidatus Obscuribacterales bacterium]